MNAIIRATGEIIQARPNNRKDFKLEELQSIVGGYIEIVYLNDEQQHLMVVNEDGKGMNLPVNMKATHIYRNHTNCNDVIVGDVLICENNKIK